jgi:large-conductance mechanosensitive channel
LVNNYTDYNSKSNQTYKQYEAKLEDLYLKIRDRLYKDSVNLIPEYLYQEQSKNKLKEKDTDILFYGALYITILNFILLVLICYMNARLYKRINL